MDRITTIVWIATLGSTACFSLAARADDFPARKAGLWEITMTMAGSAHKTGFCIDAATDAAMYNTNRPNY